MNRVSKALSFREYLAHPAYGSSDLTAIKSGSPAFVKWRREHRDEEEVTDATRIGKAAHCAILTPDLFAAGFVVKPEGMEFRSNENKAIRDGWLKKGLTMLTQDEWRQVEAVTLAFHCKRLANTSLIGATGIEWSLFWKCRETGLQRKTRPDWFDGEAVYDLKVSIEAEKDLGTLSYRAHANGWANQLANGKAGLEANGYTVKCGRLVVIAPNPPQDLRVWLLELRENDLDFLEMDNQNSARVLAECERSGSWPGTPESWTQIELPASAAFTEADLEGAEEIPI